MAHARLDSRSEFDLARVVSMAADSNAHSRPEPPLSLKRLPAIRTVVALLIACWTFGILSRLAISASAGWGIAAKLLNVSSFAMLAAAAIYVLLIVRSTTRIRQTIGFALVLLLLAQAASFMNSRPGNSAASWLAVEYPVNDLVRSVLFMGGGVLFTAGCLFAVIDSEDSRRRLAKQRKKLARAVRERETAQRALEQTSVALEHEVAERTAELARANAQLRQELAVRRRTEESLAERLRYEEGLSACSKVLLTDANPHDAITHGLQELLRASRAAQVYLFENTEESGRGLCAQLTCEVWDAAKCPKARATPDLTIPYTDDSEIYTVLSQNQHCMTLKEEFSDSVRAIAEPGGIQSLLLLPIHWEGAWRGFLGFAETTHQRIWNAGEIRMLRTAADMVAVCRERQRADEYLRRAYSELEERVVERTADLSRTNEQLQREIEVRHRAEDEAVQLERQLRQAQKMQAIGTLAGGIAHDFNNILASILGFAELAYKKLPTDRPELRRYVEEVLKSGNRAKELVYQILIFSRQNEPDTVPVHPHLIAQEVLALLRASCPGNILIRHQINHDAGAVKANPIQLHQAILNLGINAQQAMKLKGGTLEISVKPLRLEETLRTPQGDIAPGSYVQIAVSDTGSGMDPHTLERVFEPFFTTKSLGEGTGLGLSIVHGIVTSMNGVIAAVSAPQEGTTFCMYLPQCAVEIHRAAAAPSDALRGSERILVVDDEMPLLSLWGELLEGLGYRVTSYSDPNEALNAFAVDPDRFDAAVVDQQMQRIPGLELATRLLHVRPGLPVVLATSFSDDVSIEAANALGIYDVVRKPILGNDLGRTVRDALDHAQPVINIAMPFATV